MFLFSYRGVVFVLILFTLYSLLTVSGRYGAVEPWINGAMFVLIALMFVRISLK